jgi:hypothetical protein
MVRYAAERWGNLWIAEDSSAALQANGETRSVVTASSIRRRSAAWAILLDWTYRFKETSVCIVDDTGKIVREVKLASGSELTALGLR